jgi:hypothetical protein
VGRGHRSARRQRRGTERRCGGRRGDGASCARHRDGCLRSDSCRAGVRRDRRCARKGRHPRQPRLHADLRHPARDPARRLGEGAPHQSDQLPPLRAAGRAPDDRAGNRRRGHEHVLDRGHFRLRPRELSLQREQGRRRDDDEGDGGRMGPLRDPGQCDPALSVPDAGTAGPARQSGARTGYSRQVPLGHPARSDWRAVGDDRPGAVPRLGRLVNGDGGNLAFNAGGTKA